MTCLSHVDNRNPFSTKTVGLIFAYCIVNTTHRINSMYPRWQVEKGHYPQSTVVLIFFSLTLFSLHATLVVMGCLWGLSFWVEVHSACEHARATVTDHHGYSKICTSDRGFAESFPATRNALRVSSPQEAFFLFLAFCHCWWEDGREVTKQ